MKNNISFFEAREMLLEEVGRVGSESVPLSNVGGRVLARELCAAENIPAFDRSPYDGYAFRAADSFGAGRDCPVTLRIIEEIPAGAVPTKTVTEGTAVKILTGAPIPPGADTVLMFEDTEFTDDYVIIFAPAKVGGNIVRAGEDVRKGTVLSPAGEIVDPGLAGTLAAQGITMPEVYRRPRVAIISTGSELVEAHCIPGPGKIRNSNRHMLETAVNALGCEAVYMGTAGDSAKEICALIEKALEDCDAIVSTGGVSVGDYDLTPEAMLMAGTKMLFHGVELKPGMACAYGLCHGKLICALSGNPASSITNFHALASPALKKLAGLRSCLPKEIEVCLLEGFRKKSMGTRLLRGSLEIIEGKACMHVPSDQGNVVLSSTVGCNVMAIVPAGSGPVSAGTMLKGFVI